MVQPWTILMTGGTGYLGSHVLRAMISEGHRVVLLKRPTSRLERIEDLLPALRTYDLGKVDLHNVFKEHAVDAVVHCATQYGRAQSSPLGIVEANLLLPLQLLQIGVEHGLKAFVNTDTILDKRVNEYTLSKKHFLDWLQTYKQRMICANLALEHFYGPGDDSTKFVSWVAGEFARKAPKIDLTLGEQKRDFVYIDDVVSAFTTVVKFLRSTSPGFYDYEVGTGTHVSVRELVEKIRTKIGSPATKLLFGAMPYRPNEVMESKVNLAPLKALGWTPRVSLEEGLDRMLKGAHA